MIEIIFILAVLVGIILIWQVLKARNLQLWIMSYIGQLLSRKPATSEGRHFYVCLADHYEPYLGQVGKAKAHERVGRWVSQYPVVAKRHTDSYGRHPQHTYFYPEEEYDEWVMQQIKVLCDQGLGDVEVHLHHDDDTAENLEKTLNQFKSLLHEKHGFLRKDSKGEIVYGFIHGNWALDNSSPDKKWCGVDNELEVLLNTGCVFDMTMPSAPSDTQTSTINSIYLAKEDGQCKSHDKGRILEVGSNINTDELLMIQGPLTLDWKNRKMGLLPRIETGEISGDAPPKSSRVKLWEQCAVSVKGAENHVFIKLHTHGLDDRNSDMLFDQNGFDRLWTHLENAYKNNTGTFLHYMTAWEMNEKIKSIAKAQH